MNKKIKIISRIFSSYPGFIDQSMLINKFKIDHCKKKKELQNET